MTQHASNTRPNAYTQTGSETSTYYAQHDFDGTAKLSTTLIHALSEVANIDTTDTETTLYQHIDPEALDTIFAPAGSEAPRSNGQLSFPIWGYNVTIYSNGQIVISAPQQPPQQQPQQPMR
jgi:hypothetical protein